MSSGMGVFLENYAEVTNMPYPPDAYYDEQLKLLQSINSHLADISANVLDITERLERVEKSVEALVETQGSK